MNFCIFCGLEMPKDAKYCQMCGKRQPKNNNDQQEVQESEDKKSLLESPQKLIVIGIGAFINSTMLRKLKALDYEGASREFGKWVYSKGKKLDGLIKRRESERSLFLKEEVTDE